MVFVYTYIHICVLAICTTESVVHVCMVCVVQFLGPIKMYRSALILNAVSV